MVIQILLITAILLIGIYFVKSRNSSRTKAYKKIMLLLFIPCAAVVILFPSLTTDAARLVGVGRGADLLLYGVTMVLIFLLFNNYIKDRENQRKMVELARMLAILDAQINNKK